MISLIVTLAIIGVIAGCIVAFVPMLPWIRNLIIAVTLICCLIYVAQSAGVHIHDQPVPQIGR